MLYVAAQEPKRPWHCIGAGVAARTWCHLNSPWMPGASALLGSSSSSPARPPAPTFTPPPYHISSPTWTLQFCRCARRSQMPLAQRRSSKILSYSINKSRFFLLQIVQESGFFKQSLSVPLSRYHVVDDPRAAVCDIVKGRVGVVEGWGVLLLLLDVARQQVRETEMKQTTIRMQEVVKSVQVMVWHKNKIVCN